MLCLECYLILCRKNLISCGRNRLYHVEPLLYYNNYTLIGLQPIIASHIHVSFD